MTNEPKVSDTVHPAAGAGAPSRERAGLRLRRAFEEVHDAAKAYELAISDETTS